MQTMKNHQRKSLFDAPIYNHRNLEKILEMLLNLFWNTAISGNITNGLNLRTKLTTKSQLARDPFVVLQTIEDPSDILFLAVGEYNHVVNESKIRDKNITSMPILYTLNTLNLWVSKQEK